jgi:hypothetical protein
VKIHRRKQALIKWSAFLLHVWALNYGLEIAILTGASCGPPCCFQANVTVQGLQKKMQGLQTPAIQERKQI